MKLMNSLKQQCFLFTQQSEGFSLVETIMMVGIISIIVVPALMVMDRQAEYLAEFADVGYVEIHANTLFNNVDLNHPQVASHYDETSSPRRSVYCDPAGKTQPVTAFNIGQTCDTGGTDATTTPYFERTVDFVTPPGNTNGTQAISVTVAIYEADSGGTPIFEETRRYEVEGIHIGFNTDSGLAASAPTTPLINTTPGTSVNDLRTDFQGNLWWPYSPANADRPDNLVYTFQGGGCTNTTNVTTAARPFEIYQKLIPCSDANGFETLYRALSNTYYQVNIYFESYDGTDENCVTNTIAVSCDLAHIVINSRPITAGPALGARTRLVEEGLYDVTAATNDSTNQGLVKTYLVKTPSNADFIEVDVQPTNTGTTGSQFVNVAAIEIIRRQDLND